MSPFLFFKSSIDERFLLHRYKSTSHAGITAALLLGAWFFYEQIKNGVNRTDFLIVLAVMAVVKVTFMIWYHLKD